MLVIPNVKILSNINANKHIKTQNKEKAPLL